MRDRSDSSEPIDLPRKLEVAVHRFFSKKPLATRARKGGSSSEKPREIVSSAALPVSLGKKCEWQRAKVKIPKEKHDEPDNAPAKPKTMRDRQQTSTRSFDL
jgi:hypothetical protein